VSSLEYEGTYAKGGGIKKSEKCRLLSSRDPTQGGLSGLRRKKHEALSIGVVAYWEGGCVDYLNGGEKLRMQRRNLKGTTGKLSFRGTDAVLCTQSSSRL